MASSEYICVHLLCHRIYPWASILFSIHIPQNSSSLSWIKYTASASSPSAFHYHPPTRIWILPTATAKSFIFHYNRPNSLLAAPAMGVDSCLGIVLSYMEHIPPNPPKERLWEAQLSFCHFPGIPHHVSNLCPFKQATLNTTSSVQLIPNP